MFFSLLHQSLSDLRPSADETIATDAETPEQPGSGTDSGVEPKIPAITLAEVPAASMADPEGTKEVKVKRRASSAPDRAQKIARRLSMPGNLLSFLTGGSRRKSGFWGEAMKTGGNQEQKDEDRGGCSKQADINSIKNLLFTIFHSQSSSLDI